MTGHHGRAVLALALVVAGARAEQAIGANEAAALPAPTASPPAAASTARAGESAGPLIRSRRDKVSYAVGADLARDLKRRSADVDPALVLRALSDALAGEKLVMTDDEVTATLQQYEIEAKEDFEHAKWMLGEKNRRAAEAFVAHNVKQDGVVLLPSGLQYKVLKKGEGRSPNKSDEVVCNYRGTLIDGTEIDSSYRHNKPSTLRVNRVIAGLSEALQLMPIGSKWQIFIPPALAYGDKIVAGFGPNAMLIFEVELLSIKDQPSLVSKQ